MENLKKSINKVNMKCDESVKLSEMPNIFVKDKGKQLDTTQTWITDKMEEIELDVDQIEPKKSDHYKRVKLWTFEILGDCLLLGHFENTFHLLISIKRL